jgi:D-beta-D-heptose 7-phosphate kinase/D-beta-D-heptose 1-phosphate adenosyltransferase
MSDKHVLFENIDLLPGARVLCIGDVMLDKFIYGSIDRISPEAPIPVLLVTREKSMLGGAGNVLLWAQTLLEKRFRSN